MIIPRFNKRVEGTVYPWQEDSVQTEEVHLIQAAQSISQKS